MTNQLIAVTQNTLSIRHELNLIGANARGLKEPGKQLLPLKPDMLALPYDQSMIVMDTVELLFAAIIQFVDSQMAEETASELRDSIALVKARIDRGQSDGTIRALLYGPTRQALRIACEQAPIAMHSILQISPELRLLDRLRG
jgi:hypothetical protein